MAYLWAADLELELEHAGGLTLNLALKPRLVRPVCCSAAFLQGAMWEGLYNTGTWFWEHAFADFVVLFGGPMGVRCALAAPTD